VPVLALRRRSRSSSVESGLATSWWPVATDLGVAASGTMARIKGIGGAERHTPSRTRVGVDAVGGIQRGEGMSLGLGEVGNRSRQQVLSNA
jgi:hypothetical protein